MKTAVLYVLSGQEVARVEAARIEGARGFSDILLITDRTVSRKDIGKSIGRRPDLFVIVLSNEPGRFALKRFISALASMFSLRPVKKKIVFYSWSGRHELQDAAGELAKRVLAVAFRPLYLAGLRLTYVAGEAFFHLNGKRRKKVGTYNPRKILLISLDLVGDLVWAAPAISVIKKARPDAEVHLLVARRNMGLAKMLKGVDKVIGYDAPWLRKIHDPSEKGGWKPSRIKNLSTRLKLLGPGYDLTVDFRGEPRNDVLAYFTGAPFRAGLVGKPVGMLRSGDAPFLLTRRFSFESGGHIMERHLGMVKTLGFSAELPRKWLTPDNETREGVRAILRSNGIGRDELIIGIQPGASRPEKRWDKEGFIAVAKALAEKYHARVVITGSSDEGALCRYISEKIPGSLSLAGRTSLPEFISIAEACVFFITNETSAISISSAVGTPVICLMTGVPELYGPYGVPHRVVQKMLECYKPVGEHCFCPYGYKCLQEIKPEEVLDAAADLMKELNLIP